LLHSCSLSRVFGRRRFSLASNSSRRESSSSCLTTPGPASPRFEIRIELGHGNTGPSPPPLVAHRSTVPTKPRICFGRPQPATVIIHTEHAEGGSIASCYLRAKGKGDMLPDLLKAAVLLAWEIRFAVRISRASLLYDYLRTGIFFVFEHFFLIFFSRKCCAPPSDRER